MGNRSIYGCDGKAMGKPGLPVWYNICENLESQFDNHRFLLLEFNVRKSLALSQSLFHLQKHGRCNCWCRYEIKVEGIWIVEMHCTWHQMWSHRCASHCLHSGSSNRKQKHFQHCIRHSSQVLTRVQTQQVQNTQCGRRLLAIFIKL